MVSVPEFIEDTTDKQYLGNSMLNYLIAIILFVTIFLTLYVIKFIIIHRLSNVSKVNKNTFLKVLINTLKKYISMSFVVILSLYISTRHLKTSKFIETATEFIVLTLVGLLLLKFINNLIDAIKEDQYEKEVDNLHIIEFFSLIVRSFGTIIVLIWVLSNIGVDVTSFLAGLGILSLGIAFALKEIIADIFASIILMIDKPFEVGDPVKIGDDTGVVESIGIRSSKIRATDGYLIIASNRELTSKKINNMKRMTRRRISITFQISQETPRSKLPKVSEIIQELIQSDPNLIFDKVNLINIGDYAYDYEIIYYVKVRDIKVHFNSKQQLLFGLIEKMQMENITLPYPIQTVIVEN